MALSDYLGSKTADYNYSLLMTCYTSLPVTGNKNQIIHEFDDGTVRVAAMTGASWYDIEVDFFLQTTANATTLFELYNNPSYANGSENTFYWYHPKDARYYTVRFMSPVIVVDEHRYPDYKRIEKITLRVEGTEP
jgi:hypothetical protein